MSDKKYLVTSTPHIRSGDSIEKIMGHVVIALLPAVLAGFYFFGFRAAAVVALSVLSSVFFEWGFQKLVKKEITAKDNSAIVTGLLLGLNLPASSPFWMPVVGSLVAIVIVKQLFGGLGQNFMNPALAARAFLLASYPTQMTAWTTPVNNPLNFGIDMVSTATPLGLLKEGAFTPATADFINAFIGNIGGCIGETSAIALIIGGLYLLYKKVITWHIPVSFIGSFFILSFIFGRNGLFTGNPLYEIIVGGLMLGAFFMATDYSSSPVAAKGRIIYGIGCGLMTALIRCYGGYPEGVSYSILLMNLTVPLIDKYIRPAVFGVKKTMKGSA